MAWATPPTFTSGDILTASNLNILSDDIEYLKGYTNGAMPGCPAIALADSGDILYLLRHMHRYLHIKTTNTGGNLTVKYSTTTVKTTSLSGTQTWDIDLNSYGLTVGAFYVVTVNINGGSVHTCHYAIESTGATF